MLILPGTIFITSSILQHNLLSIYIYKNSYDCFNQCYPCYEMLQSPGMQSIGLRVGTSLDHMS